MTWQWGSVLHRRGRTEEESPIAWLCRGRKEPEATAERGRLGLCRRQDPCPQCCSPQGYLWDNNQVVVEWLEKHMQEDDDIQSVIRENIKYLKRDYVLKHVRR